MTLKVGLHSTRKTGTLLEYLFQITYQSERKGADTGYEGIEGESFESKTRPGLTLHFESQSSPEFWIEEDSAILFGWGEDESADQRLVRVPEDYLGCFLEIVACQNGSDNMPLGAIMKVDK